LTFVFLSGIMRLIHQESMFVENLKWKEPKRIKLKRRCEMKRVKLFLMVMMVSLVFVSGAIGDPTLEEYVEYCQEQIVEREDELREVYSAKEMELIISTLSLTYVSSEEREKMLRESCKWALAKNLALAKETNLPKFVNSANLIKITQMQNKAFKEAFNYDDVDLSLFNGTPLTNTPRWGPNFYFCGRWARDAQWYGYLKVKEKDLREIAKIWDYSFEELAEKIQKLQLINEAHIASERSQGKNPPAGTTILFTSCSQAPEWKNMPHHKLSLGRFGFSQNGMFYPDAANWNSFSSRGVIFKCEGYSTPTFLINPFLQAASDGILSLSHVSKFFYSDCYKGSSIACKRDIFHRPELGLNPKEIKLKARLEAESKKAWFGIEVKVLEEGENKGRLLVTKVFEESPAKQTGIREGDIVCRFAGYYPDYTTRGKDIVKSLPHEAIENLEAGIKRIAEGRIEKTVILRKNEQKDKLIVIPAENLSVELKLKKDVPPGSF